MTWTYDGDPAASQRDAVRFAVGDTLQGDPQVSDEEIAAMLAEHGSVLLAAAALAEHLSAQFARQVYSMDGAAARGYNQRAEAYAKLAARLRAQAARSAAPVPFAGGLDAEAQFRVGMHDNTES